MGVDTLGSLNEKVLHKEIGELIRVNEALHHKEIAKIAEQIFKNDKIKLVTIAGPSSSGKTTFSKRLYIHLRANGINPIVISLDNYYIGRANVPLDENGQKDFETIEALDLKLLNQNLKELIDGKEVEIPEYNFITGEREKVGNMMKVPDVPKELISMGFTIATYGKPNNVPQSIVEQLGLGIRGICTDTMEQLRKVIDDYDKK